MLLPGKAGESGRAGLVRFQATRRHDIPYVNVAISRGLTENKGPRPGISGLCSEGVHVYHSFAGGALGAQSA